MLNKINFLTAGESHGKGLLGILEGIPSGLEIDKEFIRFHLSRRQMGFGRGNRMKIEKDFAEIYCGIRLGKTIGAPIGLIVKNLDYPNWENLMSIEKTSPKPKAITLPRPGHADLAGAIKYDFKDIRNVIERSSARETTMRVALGSICRKLLEDCNVYVASYVTRIHNIIDKTDYSKKYKVNTINNLSDKSCVRALNRKHEKAMITQIQTAQNKGDSVGGDFQVLVSGVPFGLGDYTSWNRKLNAQLSEAICSINAIKGVSFGLHETSALMGSDLHDEIGFEKNTYTRSHNNAGGIEGGMSNAQNIIINASMKPLSTLTKPLQSVDIISKKVQGAHKERTDSCAVPAAAIVAESMVCFVIADAILNKFGGDSIKQLKYNLKYATY